ncbi:putative hydratase [Actinomycetales bacterium JB111]|nr:putative hydratase [Actinomycetales bacterium JB111]
MTIPSSQRQAAADILLEAARTGVPVEPLTAQFPGLDPDDAYAVQQLQVDAWRAQGRDTVGFKVGLTSRAMQEQLGIDEPDFGVLLEGTQVEEGSRVAATSFISPRIEPEIAFVLGSDLAGPGLSDEEVAGCVDRVVGSLEIIDSRVADWRITLPDTIADNASFGGFVLGRTERRLADVDIVGLDVTLTRNGETVGTGRGADVLGSPLSALTWLANRLGTYGAVLPAGSVVLPGSVCPAADATPGSTFTADFGPLGSVSVSFEDGNEESR